MTYKISAVRHGKRRQIFAGAKVAAKTATRLAKSGWTVMVRPKDGGRTQMICNPMAATGRRGSRHVASCDIQPEFKAKLKARK